MPNNHNDDKAYSDAWNQAAGVAYDQTDDETAGRVSSLTYMEPEKVKKVFPRKEDAEKLEELMEKVRQAKDDADAANQTIENIEKFGGVILRLLRTSILKF